ncbi:O-antigen ligase family protein [Lentzea terrae]|uniref:O-antigen ligase family protein n=1 Tax=Lentzea terrae TaxID=2200761 RepID=UPI000DD33167|nr:O-antigen ligase family protein [Lentzea terrae]
MAPTEFLPPTGRRADAATLAAVLTVVLMLTPARLVLRGIPLSLTPADVASLGIGMLWLCAQMTTTLGMAKGRNGVRTVLFWYLVALMINYGFAAYRYLPADELRLMDHAAVLVIANAGMALGICDGVRSRERIDFVLKTVVVSGAGVAIVGAFQFMFKFDLTEYLAVPGLRYTSILENTFERATLTRVAGTTGHAIEFGVLMAMVLPIAAHYGFQAKHRGEPALRWWVCAGLIALGIMMSISRSAVLSVGGVGFVLFLGWSVRRRLQALGIGLAFLAVIQVTVPGLLSTFYGLFENFGRDESIKWRTHDYAAAMAEISKNLWFGRGVGTWYAPKHQIFDNQYLYTLVQEGVVGLVAFVALILTAFYVTLRVRYLSREVTGQHLALALAASLVVPLIGSATFDLISFHTVTGLMFILIGCTGALMRVTVSGGGPVPRPPAGAPPPAADAAPRRG